MSKKLILYFSYTGNTKYIAEFLHEKIEADICEIKLEQPYSENYDVVVEQGKQEVKENYLPTMKPLDFDLNQYDTIILGTPVWWYTFAPAIHTVLKQYDFTNKTIFPFITNGGWIGHTIKDIEKSCPDSKIMNPINIRFNNDTLVTPILEITNWIELVNGK